MLTDITPKSLFTGFLTTFVGFAASFAVVMQGLFAIGATEAQVVTGLMALCFLGGLAAIFLSLYTRMPITTAWSTPGAALLASTGAVDGGFAAAVGAFVLCGVLLTLTGFWKPLERAVSAIPISLANAMLAGVLFQLCLAPFTAIMEFPIYGLAIFLVWVGVAQISRIWAVPAALAVFVAISFFGIGISADQWANVKAAAFMHPEWVAPVWTMEAVVSIALPLYIVTMASQNITGYGVLRANGFTPRAGFLFAVTGAASTLGAFFGGHATNLAAITAAMCAGDEAGPDPAKRYWAPVFSGLFYLLLTPVVGAAIAFAALAPAALIKAVAGLALIGAFVGAASAALQQVQDREAAGLTFLVTASGLNIWGVSAPFWGLVAGLLLYAGQKVGRG
ncbi:MAG: benzoate/H(+) symporter BenE family transporter [Rhodobacteraceae bacterium]|nr:benzoate/H(+) symporter BenE family transporter [Paracoccaceae bacterium]